jgi:hypothetical protein
MRPTVRYGMLFVFSIALLSTCLSVSDVIAQPAADVEKSQPSDQIDPRNLNIDIGIGHLKPNVIGSISAADNSWMEKARLVLYDRPRGNQIGKIEQGMLFENNRTTRKIPYAILETYYGILTFPVLENRGNSWYRIRYKVGEGTVGTAWIETKQIAREQISFSYEPWQAYFRSRATLYFIPKKGSDLYDLPSTAGAKIANIPSDLDIAYKIREFRGDWMRVTYRENIYPCDESLIDKTKKVRSRSGWVKWRSNGRPLIWNPVKGC